MVGISLEYIKATDIIRKSTSLLTEFTGLDLEIFNINAGDVWFPCSLKDRSKGGCCKHQTADCTKIQQNVLNDIVLAKKIRFFLCPGRMTKIGIPLLLNGELAGIFFVGENGTSQIDKKKFDALSQLLYQIGNYIIENESVFLQNFRGHTLTYKQELLNKVSKYIWNNAHKSQLTLREVARSNGVSYCYLSHLFKDELKTTFVDYRKHVKMHIAGKLLKDCRLTIDQVSRAVGFDDSSYFCKSFRKVYGCTAGSFRRRFVLGRQRRKADAWIEQRTMNNEHKIQCDDYSKNIRFDLEALVA